VRGVDHGGEYDVPRQPVLNEDCIDDGNGDATLEGLRNRPSDAIERRISAPVGPGATSGKSERPFSVWCSVEGRQSVNEDICIRDVAELGYRAIVFGGTGSIHRRAAEPAAPFARVASIHAVSRDEAPGYEAR